MRRKTTTKKLNEALSNNLLKITKVETYNKTSRKTNEIDINSFRENLEFLSESGIFSNCVGWHYQDNCNADSDYIIECCRLDRSVDVIVTVYLNVGGGVDREELERMLSPIEEE